MSELKVEARGWVASQQSQYIAIVRIEIYIEFKNLRKWIKTSKKNSVYIIDIKWGSNSIVNKNVYIKKQFI